jgi:hypothetical protein
VVCRGGARLFLQAEGDPTWIVSLGSHREIDGDLRDGVEPAGPEASARLIRLVVYLTSPFELIPDVIPVLGYADDALIAAVRSVTRHAGCHRDRAALARHPGRATSDTPPGRNAAAELASAAGCDLVVSEARLI